jgi:pimeloyl-ACP methyl ester carboxylesterase
VAGGYEAAALADDIAAVVDELKLDRFVLVGHSMGGAAATAYVAKYPQRVAGLVLVGTPGKSPPEMANQVLTAMKADYDKVNEEYWKKLLTGARPEVESQVRADLKRVPKDVALNIITAIFAHDPLPALQSYKGPTLIIDTPHGEGPQALHNQMPAIPRSVIAGTSHWPHLDKPDEFNRILDGFLASQR